MVFGRMIEGLITVHVSLWRADEKGQMDGYRNFYDRIYGDWDRMLGYFFC